MGTIFSIGDIKPTIQSALDDLYTELHKVCRLVYPPRMEACPNCVDGNRWRTGGPIQFSLGVGCPMCNGTCKRSVEISEDVELLCNWNHKKFDIPFKGIELRAPYSVLETKGYIDPVASKIMRCDHLIVQVPLQGVMRRKFRLLSSPIDRSNIIQGRYFICLWESIE